MLLTTSIGRNAISLYVGYKAARKAYVAHQCLSQHTSAALTVNENWDIGIALSVTDVN